MDTTTKAVLIAFAVIGILASLLFLWKLSYQIFRVCKPSKNLQSRYGTKGESTWALVTGSSSGIGVHFAHELAAKGFNVVLAARRKEKLEIVAQEIRDNFNDIKVAIVTLDLMSMGQKNESCRDFLNAVDEATGNGDIGILVANAGNSDLARHFTDHPLDRNRDMLHLNTLGNLSLIQTMMPRLIRENSRSCIITVGALSAVAPLPGFATSSANKAYLRHLSLCINKEYQDNLDVLVAHPLAVKSEILSNSDDSVLHISASKFVKGILSRLGNGYTESYGWWLHDLLGYLITDVMSYDQRSAYWIKNVPKYSELLQRPVNMSPIQDKIQEV